ncbi:hypothetical protein XBP1_310003 [Xenorhabdus bovienii str. puntauvense]|uniref:Uncharacterized protein n=1 Tax=Xenorhabdus bovienii str. puntauvense TaxID=1398201 RepID=A0A077NJ50_XENBV|nr:hypothetical protein [Xenorhabdus bovienii]CDG98488.1 hypothetical protein XBP1_310003 [Xenorhabdus bovienii str. puntauvense]
MKKEFHVVAGKYETFDDELEENVKFCDFFDTIEEAKKCVIDNKLTSYPFCRIETHLI